MSVMKTARASHSAATVHAPGPWGVGAEYGNTMDEIECADGRTVAIVWARRAPVGATARAQFTDDPELAANRALLVAAPELLAALDTIARQCGPFAEVQPALDYATIGNIARAAIAKAKGETK